MSTCADSPWATCPGAVWSACGTPSPREERLRNYRGFIARLTPEQIAAMQATDEFEVLGPANGPKRKL